MSGKSNCGNLFKDFILDSEHSVGKRVCLTIFDEKDFDTCLKEKLDHLSEEMRQEVERTC